MWAVLGQRACAVGGWRGTAAGWLPEQGALNRLLWLEGGPDLRASLQGAGSDPQPTKAAGAGVSVIREAVLAGCAVSWFPNSAG